VVAETPCPIGRAVETIGDRWTLLILRHATLGITRFDQFRGELGIADNILSNRLSRLVEAGLLVKVPYRDERRTRHEYRLTEASADLLPVLHALADWGQKHTRSNARTQPMRTVHTPCGTDLTRSEFCDSCDRETEREEITWVRPWRTRTPFPLAEPVS
jgi:DNA-binding HxlR family transcriptional regulator